MDGGGEEDHYDKSRLCLCFCLLYALFGTAGNKRRLLSPHVPHCLGQWPHLWNLLSYRPLRWWLTRPRRPGPSPVGCRPAWRSDRRWTFGDPAERICASARLTDVDRCRWTRSFRQLPCSKKRTDGCILIALSCRVFQYFQKWLCKIKGFKINQITCKYQL